MYRFFSGLLKFLVQVPVPHFNSVFLLPFLTLQTFNLVGGGRGIAVSFPLIVAESGG